MSSPPPPQTIYLDGAREPVCAILHEPASGASHDTAVLLCPPFGWDEVCSYRSLREWAQRLAAAGYPTIRLSFPGTGDSGGGPRDPERLEAWTSALAHAVSWVASATGAPRTAAVGIGLGGLIVHRVAAAGAPIDDLVLWATPARARSLIRQLRAFSKLEASQFFEGLEPPPPLPPGELEAGGFLLTAETVHQLERLDLTELPLQASSSRRVLLLERDGIAVDAHLVGALESWGVAVTIAPGNGYAAMTAPPQQAEPPLELIARVTSWLDEASAVRAPAQSRWEWAAGAAREAQVPIAGGAYVRETALGVDQPFGQLAGILTEPLGPREPGVCTILLNAGAIRRTGPSRMWVEAARRWAGRGVPTLRLDIEGIGDADGDASDYVEDAGLYVPGLVPQVLATLDVLQERGIADRFVLAGLCSGAYWSFHAAVQDPRVIAAWMVNPRALIWDPALIPARDFRAFASAPLSLRKIREQASSARVRALALWMFGTPQRKWSSARGAGSARNAKELDDALEALRVSGKRALLLFSSHEPLHDELVRSGRMARLQEWANMTVDYIDGRDHTLRPTWTQRQAHEALDRALDRELALSRSGAIASLR